MLKLNASAFTRAISMLQRVQVFMEGWEDRHVPEYDNKTSLNDKDRDATGEHIQDLIGAIKPLGVPMTMTAIIRMSDALRDETFNFQDLKTHYERIEDRLHDEIDAVKVFCLDKAQSDLYESTSPLFGLAVDSSFPTAKNEIEEAGKCLALRRPTASVMHTMRILEIGLQAIASDLGVPTKDNWNTLLNEVDRIIPEVSAKRNGAQDEQWFSEASAHFRLLKNGFRNHAMHVRETYSEEQAENIFNHAKSYMQHLATRLKDPLATLMS